MIDTALRTDLPELRRAVGVIKTHMLSPSPVATDDLRLAAEAFAKGCRYANARLAHCDLLLPVNRDEALRQIKLEPDLLEVCGVLDIDNRDWWDRYSAHHQVEAAPQLNLPASRRLNQAFPEKFEVDDLLARFRRLNLCRAPLRDRLGVLRDLCRKEPNNLGWLDDLRDHEEARYKEIRTQAANAARAGDGATLQELYDEIQPTVVANPPPSDVVQVVTQGYEALRQDEAGRQLRVLMGQLQQARAAGDLAAGRAALAAVGRVKAEFRLADGDPLLAPFSAGNHWLNQEAGRRQQNKEFNAAVAALRDALNGRAGWAEVRRCHAAAAGFGLRLPYDVGAMYAARARDRRMNLIFAVWFGAVAGGAVLAFAVWLAVGR